MGKLLYSLIIFTTFQVSLIAQDPEFVWANQLGGTNEDIAFNITTDVNGNIYITGWFSGTCDFDPSSATYNLTSFGGTDIFVSKLDGEGNFIWAKQMGGPLTQQSGSIFVDNNGYVYTTGQFQSTCDFDPGSGIYNLTSFGSTDIFVSKLDSLGNFVWAKQMGGTFSEIGYSITVDANGNVYTTGYFSTSLFGGTSDFDPGSSTYNFHSFGGFDIFVSKLNSSGNFVWAKQMGGTNNDESHSISITNNGTSYISGHFRGTCDFDPSSQTYNLSAQNADIFTAKLDSSGNFVWAKQMGGISDDISWSLSIDENENSYITGSFAGTCDFDPSSNAFNLTSFGSNDVFIAKLDVSGNFVWAKQLGGTSNDVGSSISNDGFGNVITIGRFENSCDFDPSADTNNLISFGGTDIFVSKLDSIGNFFWANQMGGASNDIGYSIALDNNGNNYSTGYFNGTGDFDPSSQSYNLTSFGNVDIFVVKLLEECLAVNISIEPMSQTANVCGNATFSITANGPPPFNYTWYKNGIIITNANSHQYSTPTLNLTDDGNTYYCIVSNCNGVQLDTSTTATLTVIPPCIFSLPSVTLNKSIAVPGENIIVTGSNFTPNGDIDVLIENESGQDVTGVIPITYINPGMFEFTLLVTSTFSDGEYTVTAQDISTGNTTPPKSFIVNNFIFTPLEITFPSITSTIFKYKTFDIEWKDFISSAPVNGQTGELLKEYTIEASPNNGGIWYQIATKTYKATTGKSNTFTYPYSVTTIGPYLFRITEIGNPQNTATSPPLTAIECDDGGFVASLQWDATVPDDVKSKKPYPYGLAADGAARIYVKLNKNNATLGVSTIQATIQTVGNNGYSGTALLGRIAHASATEIISTSTTYPAGSNNNSNANSYWFWLVAPDDFTTDLSSEEKYREINVDFTITYSDNSTELITLCEPIQICRPALVFAHGILGTQESFKYAQFNNNSGGTSYFSLADFDIWKEVKLLDLKEWGSYQVNADILLGKDPDENQTYENSIISIIKQMHFYGFANKRIDYVAHSMGGAVGRTVINNGGSWYSPGVYQLRNYGKGYINKYISICTPHNGSPIADVAVDAFNAIILLAGQNSVSATIAGAVLATSYFKDLGFVYKGSISQAIANLQAQSGGVQQTETTVKNHLISADVDEYNNTSQNDVLNSISTSDVFGLGMTALFKAIRVVSPIQNFFSTNYGSSAYLSNSDLIVPLSSQLAGKLQPSPFDITTNTTGVSKTSIIYGLDKQHVGIQKNLSIGTRLKVLLNAQMASGFFDETIPPYTVNQNLVGDGEILSRRSTGCMDTVLAYIDTFKIKITSPTSNSILYIDSSLQIAINLKDTIGFENLRVLYKSTFYYSTAKDSIQYFLTTINPSDLGLNSIVAVAQYDSMGCTVYYIDTIAINVATLDSLEGFYITPRARYLNPVQDFAPVYHAVYSTCIGVLRPEADSLTFMILDTNVVVYDSLYRNFVTKDTGSTHIVFSFEGYNDTMFVYISTKNIDNVSSICPLDSIFLYAGVTDSTKSYQWQVDTLNGFSNIIDNLNYTGTDSSTLIINSTPSQWFDYKYRCIISDAYGATESDVFTLRFGMVWTGVIDTTWENPGNWSCNAIPDCNTEVYIPSDAPRYPNIFSEAYCKSIHLADSAYLNVKAGYQLWVGTSNAFLTCPSNVTINLDPGTCDAQYIFSFSLEGVCGSTISQTSGLLSGSFFPIGTTTNCFDLLDNYGAILASCCFDVTVIEYPTPTTTLACNDNIQVSINEICEAFVSTDVILEGGPYSCYNDYLVAVEGYGSGFGGVTITSSAIGQTLNVTVTDPSTGNSCSGTISVEDKIVPQVICSDFTSSCSTYIEPDSTNTPIATDNCGGVILTYSDEEAPGSCPGFSTLIRHWVVTDSSGNSNTCDQIISFLPASLDSVTCPPTYVGSCSGYNSPGTTGYPVYNGEQIDYNGLCNLFAFYSDQDTIIEGYFTVLRTWRIVDTCASLEIECIQNIISTDNEDPILSCPNDYETSCIQSTAPEIAGFPTYSDNCNSTLSYIDSAISGDPCESQNFSRTWTVLDNSNNFATCIQYFTLLPVTLDSLVCPSSYIGSCGDNSDPSVMGYPSIDGYPINENGPCNFFYGYSDQDSITCDGAYITRTWTISDWCTQQTTVCIQDIDLLNNTGQILACPEDILVSIEVGESNVPVGYNVSSACNCGDTIVQTAGLDSGESFPIGTTSNCFILLDSLGATIDSCCFDVTVTVFCLVGGIVFNTQEQIDSFSVNYPFCSIINGPVTIEGSDITNLDGLSSIRYIEGSLIIWNNPVLDDLSGLDSLTYVGEIFTIANNSSLLHIPGFNSIQHIGNYLQFIQDSLLSDISGFNTINSIPELNIQINTALESITGFQSLTSIQTGSLLISNNPELNNLSGFSSLISIGDNLYSGLKLYDNDSLTSLSGFDNLTSITGNFELNGNNSLINLTGMSSLESITGGLLISNNPVLINLNNLGALSFIGRVIQITNNFSLTNLVGLDQLSSVGTYAPLSADNIIQNNLNLIDLVGLNALTYISGSLHIKENPLLQSLEGLDNINAISGSLSVENNNILTNLTGFNSLTSVGTGLYIQGNSALLNLNGLDSLAIIGGPFLLQNNIGLVNLEGINNLNDIGGDLYLSYNTSLSSLSGIDSLQNIGGELFIQNNSILSECDVQSICDYLNIPSNPATISGNAIGCFSRSEVESYCNGCPLGDLIFTTQSEIDLYYSTYPGCSTITGGITINGADITNLDGLTLINSLTQGLQIYNNPLLESLEGLAGLKYVGGELSIGGNPLLDSLAGLDSLNFIGGSVHITSNDSLLNLIGLNSLANISGLEISNNISLINLHGLESVTSLQGMGTTFSGNLSLESLLGLDNVTNIDFNLNLSSNPNLTDLDHLSNLNSINGGLYITDNSLLSNLSGLDSITGFNGSLTIFNNPSLSICNAQFICDFLSTSPEIAVIHDNAFGCDNVAQVQIACGIPVTCPGILTLNSQAEIDSFPSIYSGCSTIAGPLTITGSDITNLDSLVQIDSITQGLSIGSNPLLESLIGLIELKYLGGGLDIVNNARLENLMGLDSLSFIGGPVHIIGNDSLISLIGLNSISHISGLQISSNNSLINLQGLNNVIQLQGMGTTISNNLSLVSLLGLDNVASIEFTLNLSDNPNLSNLDHLIGLQSINGSLFVSNNTLLSNLTGLNNVAGFNGGLNIIDNPLLSTCEAQFICEYLSVTPEIANIQNNALGCNNVPQVQIACGIPVTCPGILTFNSQAEIDSFPSTYPGCSIITGELTISGPDITNLDSLVQIDSITQGLSIGSNPLLESLIGLIELKYLGGGLDIVNNARLGNLIGLDSLSFIGGPVHIIGNDSLISLIGLNSISHISGLQISSNNSLINLQGLNNVIQLQGMGTTISNNLSLVSLLGLDNVASIEFTLNLSDNPNLSNLDHLIGLQSINGSLYISGNSLMSSLTGLLGVTSINGGIYIINNDALLSLSGLDSLSYNSITDLHIQNSGNLSICDVASICNYLAIPANPATISGNAVGCASRLQVEEECGN